MAKKETTTTEEIPATPIAEVAEYNVIVDFKGSQDGRFTEDFEAGSVVELTASLAEVAIAEGWAKPVQA
jgi:hypothetical protein